MKSSFLLLIISLGSIFATEGDDIFFIEDSDLENPSDQIPPKKGKAQDLKISPEIVEIKQCMQSGRSAKALNLIENYITYLLKNNPESELLRSTLPLMQEECYHNLCLNTKHPTLRIKWSKDRAHLLESVKRYKDFDYCIANDIYFKLINALLDQCDPINKMGADSAPKALKQLNEYEDLLKEYAPDHLKKTKMSLKLLRNQILDTIKNQIFIEANDLLKKGFNVVAASKLDELKEYGLDHVCKPIQYKILARYALMSNS